MRGPGSGIPALRTAGLLAGILLLLHPPHASGQSDPTPDLCRADSGAPSGGCLSALSAALSWRSDLLTAASGGSPFPGTASTLGQRIPGVPRIGIGGGIRLLPGSGATGGEGGDWTGVAHADLAVGLLPGFSPLPTVGGVLALDLLLSAARTLPFGRGDSHPPAANAWSVGARVGLLRESFTLPGVSLSVRRSESGSIDSGPFSLRSSGWSLRAVAGKDVLGFGLHAGAGMDLADAPVRTTDPSAGPEPAPGSNRASRTLYFAGGSWSILVLQLGGELGWAEVPRYSGTSLPAGLREGGAAPLFSVWARLVL